MNWDDPGERYRLIERVGSDEYTRLLQQHRASTVATVNGYPIHVVKTRFGHIFVRIFIVGTTIKGFTTLDEAKAYAAGLKAPEHST